MENNTAPNGTQTTEPSRVEIIRGLSKPSIIPDKAAQIFVVQVVCTQEEYDTLRYGSRVLVAERNNISLEEEKPLLKIPAGMLVGERVRTTLLNKAFWAELASAAERYPVEEDTLVSAIRERDSVAENIAEIETLIKSGTIPKVAIPTMEGSIKALKATLDAHNARIESLQKRRETQAAKKGGAK